MSVRTQADTERPLWFITFTCFQWRHLFEITQSYDTVYKWFDYLHDNKLADVICYVIMPNHFHAILNLPQKEKTINTLVGNAKRFLAYEIIKRLEDNEETKLLSLLGERVAVIDKSKGQKHRVFEPSFDGKTLYTGKFLRQKMNYIHRNPVRGKWKLADDYVDYEHSSASFYELGLVKRFKPKHFMDI